MTRTCRQNRSRNHDEAVVLPSPYVLRFLAAFAIVAASMLIGCDGSGQRERPNTVPQAAIQVAQVSVETVRNEVAVPAKVQADPERIVHVLPPVSGRLVSLNVRPGEEIKPGQTIAIIESSDAASARSDYNKARIEVERSQQAEKRAALLLQHEVLAQKDYEDIKAQAESAKAELDRAEQRLRMLGLAVNGSSDDVAVKSPRPGVVLDIGTANGELSKSLDNATSIATVADLRSVWVLGDLYEKDLELAARGTKVQITFAAFPGQTWTGTISNVSDVLDATTRTMKVRVILPNQEHRLKPEMFATIHLPAPKRNVINVPATAVLHEGDSAFVMVKKADGTYEKRSVVTANAIGEKTEIASGLHPGELVVTSGAELLRGEGASDQ